MSERFLSDRVALHCGDCRDVLATLPENSLDACVTDPPYHLVSKSGTLQLPSNSGGGGTASPFGSSSRGFMGKVWDGGDVAFRPETWAAVYRVLKPGAHLIACGGTRTYHRLACAIEDAGFEVRDTISFLYGSGFPKSHDVSKGIDRAAPRVGMFDGFAKHYAEHRKVAGLTHNAICERGKFYAEHNHGGASSNWEKGFNVPTLEQWRTLQPLLGLSLEWLPLIERVEAEREVIGKGTAKLAQGQFNTITMGTAGYGYSDKYDLTAPATDAAREWQGWGTALKPACELIVLARKPLSEGTVAANCLRWGTGAINVDGCRVECEGGSPSVAMRAGGKAPASCKPGEYGDGHAIQNRITPERWLQERPGEMLGRWPANVVHDGSDEVVAAFPETESGKAQLGPTGGDANERFWNGKKTTITSCFADSGSAARFFYTAKADAPGRWPANVVHDGSPEVVAAFPESDVPNGRPNCAGKSYSKAANVFGKYDDDKYAGGYMDPGSAARFFYTAKADADDRLGSKHPTVKPLDLMQWLVRLVCRKGGTVLDPFSGTGTTGEAAWREGMRAVLIEAEAEYQADCRRRMALALAGPDERQRESIKARNLPRDDGPLFESR